MGCDIHLFVERVENGKWVSADRWTPNRYAGEEGEPDIRIEYEDRFYTGRNYDLFGILADVRNGSGFAGCDTGDGFVPISEPRGIPDDVSPEVAAESSRWGEDGHSHSWLSVQELLDYDWTRTTKHRGWVSAPTFWAWNRLDRKRGESPRSWSGMVDGGAIKKVTEPEMLQLLEQYGDSWSAEDRIKRDLGGHHCLVEWEQPYYKAARHFLSDTLPRLWRLGKPDEVRIVFWFDN